MNMNTKLKNTVNQITDTTSTWVNQAFDSTSAAFISMLSVTQGALASVLSTDLNSMLNSITSSKANLYDKAMDAAYNLTRNGGGNHRMFDGGHTLSGAFKAVREASPDDTIIQEAMGFVEGLFKDLTTPKGLPLVNWDKSTYDQVANYLQSSFDIPKDWFSDMMSYDASELLGGLIGAIAVAFAWSRSTTEKFSKIVGGMLIPALRGNPILMIVTVVSLAKAFHKAHVSGEYTELLDGTVKGGISSGATMVAVAQVSALGGPAGLALLVGVSTGLLAAKATQKVSVRQIGDFVAGRTKIVVRETRKLYGIRSHKFSSYKLRNSLMKSFSRTTT